MSRARTFPAVVLLAFALAAGIMLASPGKAHASSRPRHLTAFFWARAQRGKPYVYGGTGPSGFDCSGLVQTAYRHAGINLPRTTYGMLASGKLVPETARQARRGDLAFYGSGHVEMFVRRGHTFGAHQTGTLIGWIHYGFSWVPTMFFRVRGAG